MQKTGRKQKPGATESVDDYLKAVYGLGGEEHRRGGGSELATRLGVAPASVTNMLQKLSAEPKVFCRLQES